MMIKEKWSIQFMVIQQKTVKIVCIKSKEQAAERTIHMLKEEQLQGRLHTLGLATGSTMLPVYEELLASDMTFEQVTAFNLDEYVGLANHHPQSYAYFMQEQLFSRKPFQATYIPNGVAEDVKLECLRYEQLLEEHPIDIQFLGVGENGHIAFNEPGTSFDSVTHMTQLTSSTIEVNSRFFERMEDVPTTAITMGIASILHARKIVLLAFGERKRFALEKLLEGKITTDYPITALLKHDDVTVITDLQL